MQIHPKRWGGKLNIGWETHQQGGVWPREKSDHRTLTIKGWKGGKVRQMGESDRRGTKWEPIIGVKY